MEKFYDDLIKYVEKNLNEKKPKKFSFKNNNISFEIASYIYNIIKINNTLQEELLKEKDYNRLLRLENDSLTIENKELYGQLDEMSDIDFIEFEDKEEILLS